jgi:hypothetical protein
MNENGQVERAGTQLPLLVIEDIPVPSGWQRSSRTAAVPSLTPGGHLPPNALVAPPLPPPAAPPPPEDYVSRPRHTHEPLPNQRRVRPRLNGHLTAAWQDDARGHAGPGFPWQPQLAAADVRAQAATAALVPRAFYKLPAGMPRHPAYRLGSQTCS